jgi:hypothetical protein
LYFGISERVAAQRRLGGLVFLFHAGNQFGGRQHVIDGADALPGAKMTLCNNPF